MPKTLILNIDEDTLEINLDAEPIERTVDGVRYLVVPMVALVEGVVNGELALAEEFGRYPESWAGVPIPVNHPQVGGEFVTANRIDIMSKYVIGRFFNPIIKGNKLVGQAWIEIEKAKKVVGGDGILKAIRANQILEVSTAYWRDVERKGGTFNEVTYTAVQRNLRPDHIAILTDEPGACSVRDGCGIPRTNQGDHDGASDSDNLVFNGEKTMPKQKCKEDEVLTNEGDEVLDDAAATDQQVDETVSEAAETHDDETAETEETQTAQMTDTTGVVTPDNTGGGTGSGFEQMGAWLADLVDRVGGQAKFEQAILGVAANRQNQRAVLIKKITANSGLTAADLEPMNDAALGKLADSLTGRDYSGAAGAVNNGRNRQGDNTPPPPPKVVLN